MKNQVNLNSDGSMAVNQYIEGYYVGADGA